MRNTLKHIATHISLRDLPKTKLVHVQVIDELFLFFLHLLLLCYLAVCTQVSIFKLLDVVRLLRRQRFDSLLPPTDFMGFVFLNSFRLMLELLDLVLIALAHDSAELIGDLVARRAHRRFLFNVKPL